MINIRRGKYFVAAAVHSSGKLGGLQLGAYMAPQDDAICV